MFVDADMARKQKMKIHSRIASVTAKLGRPRWRMLKRKGRKMI
jgi:hypothetical protein